MSTARWKLWCNVCCGLMLSACLDPFPEDPGVSNVSTPVNPLPDNTVPAASGVAPGSTSTAGAISDDATKDDAQPEPSGSAGVSPVAPTATGSEPPRDPSEGVVADASVGEDTDEDAEFNDASARDAGPDADADGLEPAVDGGVE